MKLSCILVFGAWAQLSQAAWRPLVIENFVDQRSPEYEEYLEVKKAIDRLQDEIAATEKKRMDPVDLVLRKSQIEEEYIQLLQNRASLDGSPAFYYRGDDYWYYRVIKNPHDLELMIVDAQQGPLYSRLNSGSLVSTLPLKNPLIHLLSFNQIENICGFAALANAKALETQMVWFQDGGITFAETRRLAEANLDIVRPVMEEIRGNIVDAGQERLARASTRLNFENEGNIEYLDKHAVDDLHKRLKLGKYIERTGELEKKIASLDKVHIIYSVDEVHWVLLSVLKVAPGQFTMYLLNSSNAPLTPQDDITLLVSYIDDVIEQGVHLARALEAPDMKVFNKAIKSKHLSKAALLEELVQAYLVATDDQKAHLYQKIDAVSVFVNLRDLPVEVRNFFVRKQAEHPDLGWPKNFTAFTKACEAKATNQSTTPVEQAVKKNDNRYFMGAVVGISVCGLMFWLKTRAAQKDDAQSTAKTAAA